MCFFFLVPYLTLGRSSTIWLQASRITPFPIKCRRLTLPTSPSTNRKHLSPGWPTLPPPPISHLILQIPTQHPTWPLAQVETPQGWWPTPRGGTPTSSPRVQDKSCCSQLVIMVSHWDENVLCCKNMTWQLHGFKITEKKHFANLKSNNVILCT